MEEQKATPKASGALISLLLLDGSIWYFFGGGLEKHAATNMQEIER